MSAALKQTINHWNHVFFYTQVPRNKNEYENLMTFADELIEWLRHHDDSRATNLLNIVASNIAAYENKLHPSKKTSPVDMLQFLMEEHHLTQSDLPEIGGQSLVSKILAGERQLTLEHVRALSKRFHVSPNVFISSRSK